MKRVVVLSPKRSLECLLHRFSRRNNRGRRRWERRRRERRRLLVLEGDSSLVVYPHLRFWRLLRTVLRLQPRRRRRSRWEEEEEDQEEG